MPPRHVTHQITATCNMGRDGEDYSDLEDEGLVKSSSQPSQSLPITRGFHRPSNRRRIVDQTDEDTDSVDDFIDDGDEEDDKPARKARSKRRISVTDSLDEDEEGKAKAKKKSKYKIHIPRENTVPATTVQYGTQIPSNPDSSPYRIRGAMWKLPRKVPTGQHMPQSSRGTPVSNPKSISKPKSTPDILVTNALFEEDNASELPARSYVSAHSGPSPLDFTHELADLPSDAFSSSGEEELSGPNHSIMGQSQPGQRLVAPQAGLRQTTLFGGRMAQEQPPASQVNKVHNYRVDIIPEEPSHHKLDNEALKTWVYPTNLGAIREYQFNIVKMGLFSNMLVSLPTGLGKTFIAATIMLNYFRWTKDAQIVFMAPTKPLVSQQVDACFNIVGIPRSATTMLTGDITPAVRAEEWQEKRVFFMTPQTLDNDLRTGIADPKRIVLLVVDEAHRAKGEYSYVKVVTFMRRFSKSFRVLALTATPGSTVEAVQEVIDGLEISKVEIRTEISMDIQPFTHSRKIEQIILEPSDEMIMIQELFSKALKPLVDKLCGQNAYYNRDPMSLTAFGMQNAKKKWFLDAGRRASPGLKGMMMGLFAILGSVAHGIKLLNFHGIGPFYETVKELRAGVEEKGGKASKWKKEITDSAEFKKMMERILLWINKEDFVGHPKLTYLCDTILNHFLDAGEGRLAEGAAPSSTRVIVFSEYRDSAEDIVRVLNRHGPMIRASVFVGQADSKRSEGMNQAKQLETIRKFKAGTYNVIVATSIGEEGLDIGQVDLIVCYDASASPIRMLQRMGRTGRKRAGNIVLLLMKGKEEESFVKAQDNYEKMQKMIASGTRFSFRHDLSTRIVPKEIQPVVDMKKIDIPFENTQDPSLPEPKRRASKAKKRPLKKFNMPDGVETGFRKASKLAKVHDHSGDGSSPPPERVPELMAENPALDSVLLSSADLTELERTYQNVYGEDMQEVSMPEMNSQPICQRSLRPVKLVQHGQATKRFVNMITAMHDMTELTTLHWNHINDEVGSQGARDILAVSSLLTQSVSSPTLVDDSSEEGVSRPSKLSSVRKRHPQQTLSSQSDDSSESQGVSMTRTRTIKKATNHTKPQRRGVFDFETDDRSDSGSSSDEDEDEDEEDDDLEGFVVGDTAPLSGRESISVPSSSPPEIQLPRAKPFFEPTQFSATQETNDDEELPDIGILVGGKSTPRSRSPLKEARVNGNAGEGVRHRGKRRRVVEEDSDE